MGKGPFKDAKRVLVFNGARVLVAIVRSLQTVSDLTGKSPQSISMACTGKYVSTGGFYFRHASKNVEIEEDDIGKLKLADYDNLCGEERKYHPVREMAHKKSKENELKRKLKEQLKKLNGEEAKE